jgi:hypothetical protein
LTTIVGTATSGWGGGALNRVSIKLKKPVPARQMPMRISKVTKVIPPVVISKKALRKVREGREVEDAVGGKGGSLL